MTAKLQAFLIDVQDEYVSDLTTFLVVVKGTLQTLLDEEDLYNYHINDEDEKLVITITTRNHTKYILRVRAGDVPFLERSE